MKLTPALVRLERRLARDRTAILNASDVQLLERELRRALAESFPELPATALDKSEDVIRWQALSERCKWARRSRGIRDMATERPTAAAAKRAVRRRATREDGR